MAFNLTRRKFLQSASLAAVALPLSKVIASETGIEPSPFEPKGTLKDETVAGGICEMCFWRCQLVGKKRGDRLVKIEGNPKSIDNGSTLCARGNAGVQFLYDPDRLKYPLKNVGERGNPKWKRISWEEALDECGSKLKEIVDTIGPHGISVFPHGSSARYPMHFFERTVGTPNVSEPSFFQCRGIRDMAYISTIGLPPGESVDMPNSKVILLLGCHFGENIHVSHIKKYIKGLQNGAKLIVVDPRYSAAAAKSDVWVRIKPGTDTPFLLAIMNYLIANDKHDGDFIDEYGYGFDEFKDGISDWTLEKAAAECDIPARQIREIAELLAANAPNVAIHPGRNVSWYGNDFQRERALACLTGVLGAFFVKGGWVPAQDPRVGRTSWARKDHDDEYNLNRNEEEFPLHPYSPPGTPTELIRDAALSGNPYPIKGCVIWGSNPIHTVPGQEKMKDALRQMDFVMCVDIMPTDITMWADILLPQASYLERYDLIKTGTQWDFADSQQQYIAPRFPLVEPMFERKDQVYITNEIAKRMGYAEDIPVNSVKELVDKDLETVGLTLDQIIKEDGIHLQKGKDPYEMPEDFEVVFYSEDIEYDGFPGIPTYIPVEQPPKGFTRLISGRVPVHTFNRTQNNVWLHQAMPDNPVWINNEVAKQLGIQDGDSLGFINQDGVKSRTTTTVKITPGIRKDCIFMAHGYGSANPLLSVGVNAGVDTTSLTSKITIDPETGAHGTRTSFVQFIKDDKILAIPASV